MIFLQCDDGMTETTGAYQAWIELLVADTRRTVNQDMVPVVL